jgi:hypothetical protein
MRKITIARLKKAGACAGHLKRIRALVGSSVKVTEEWCIEHASDFDWDWAACLLSDVARAEYYWVRAAACVEYDRVIAPARAEYYRATGAAWAEGNRSGRSAWAKYEQVCGAAWAEYARVRKPARAEYDRVRAAAWARAYIQDGAKA